LNVLIAEQTMNHPREFAPLFDLPVDVRLQLVEELWDSIAVDALPPVSDEIRQELDRRHAAYLANPDSAISWEEVRRRLQHKQ
jgi:putative addiction module component (TIGR02574 family)